MGPETSVAIADAVASVVAQGVALPETTDAIGAEVLAGGMVEPHSTAGSLSAATPSLMVVAPEFHVVHDSWEAFEDALRAYAKVTYQLYVIRSTTSVKRRNLKIAESATKGDAAGNAGALRKAGLELGVAMEHEVDVGEQLVERTLIPERYQWYSKSLKCTHGWKDRHRGTGKRGSGVVRSTSCPAKMCVTLQHRGAGPDDWKVVVTKHVRTHNHQLSKELFLYYTENRRIYDPELLAVVGDAPGATNGAAKPSIDLAAAHLTSMIDQANQRNGVFRTLTPNEEQSQQHTPSMVFMLSDALAPASVAPNGNAPDNSSSKQLVALANASNKNFMIRPRAKAGTPLASMPPLGAMVLTPGTILLEHWTGRLLRTTNCSEGSNVISVACRVHGSSAGTSSTDNGPGQTSGTTHSGSHGTDSVNGQATQCTCFRIAGGGNYVTIVPATDPLPATDHSFDADDTMFYAEDTEGAWQPSSSVEIEKVTTEWRDGMASATYCAPIPQLGSFHKYLDAYSAATFQLYRVRTTYSVRSRNLRLRQLAASRGLVVREVPEEYEWYSKTFLCTHGWKRRSRGSGQRVSHNVRATECPAKVCATLQRTDGANTWSVVVTKHLVEHNHELSETLYQQYSEVRRVRDPEVLAQAEQLWRGGATRRRVFEFLKERSPNHVILMKDVHNLVQRWQALERRPKQSQQGEDDQDQNQGQQQQQPSQSSPPVVSASHDDDSSPWL
ncbi:Transcription factor IIB [Phytophthora cinnamomi]|uniref:Transcription factor IIB n=1 Tax=Phytophthora cinnamomi TaxID=4785 RepID=UPI0035596C4F|nr:Transcription factor IIB [Phytophthora cinnamomi]